MISQAQSDHRGVNIWFTIFSTCDVSVHLFIIATNGVQGSLYFKKELYLTLSSMMSKNALSLEATIKCFTILKYLYTCTPNNNYV